MQKENKNCKETKIKQIFSDQKNMCSKTAGIESIYRHKDTARTGAFRSEQVQHFGQIQTVTQQHYNFKYLKRCSVGPTHQLFGTLCNNYFKYINIYIYIYIKLKNIYIYIKQIE